MWKLDVREKNEGATSLVNFDEGGWFFILFSYFYFDASLVNFGLSFFFENRQVKNLESYPIILKCI